MSPPSLLQQLAAALEEHGVRYCQWKGHWKRERWMTGEGDVDLLVAAADLPRFAAAAHVLGCRLARPAPAAEVAGVTSWYGYDPALSNFVLLHVHTRLVIGEYWRSLCRVPIEAAVLADLVPRTLFPSPRPEVELILFVVRMTLRHAPSDLVGGDPAWLVAARPELAYLEEQSELARVSDQLARHLPAVDRTLFDRCRNALELRASPWRRLAARRALCRQLGATVRSASLLLTIRRAAAAVRRRAGAPASGTRRLAGGGLLVALVGADGAGKSTCALALHRWLVPHFRTLRVHLGRPPRALATLIVGGLRKLLPLPGLTYLRHVCTARDRYRLAVRAGRWVVDGGIALCERYPGAEHDQLVGPRIRELAGPHARGLAHWLADLEERYYRRLPAPDLRLVLRVAPDVAVRRKTDEPPDYVRRRATLVWQAQWTGEGTRVIDAGQPLDHVLADLKAVLWEAL